MNAESSIARGHGRMRTLPLLLTGLALCAGAARAEVLSVETGGWGYDAHEAFAYRGEAISVDGGPEADEHPGTRRWVQLQNLGAGVPNLRLQYRRSQLYGTRPLDGGAAEQADYLSGQTLESQANVDQYDATLYYPLTDRPGMSLDVGLNLRYLDATLTRPGDGLRDERSVSAYLPLVYAKALFDLPFAGLSAGFEGSTLQYDSNRVLDYEAKLSYEMNSAFGLQGGWRHQRLRLDDNSSTPAELEREGPFLDLYFHF